MPPVTVFDVRCTSGAPVTGVWITYVDAFNWGDFAERPILTSHVCDDTTPEALPGSCAVEPR